MKSISVALQAHLALEVTTLATCWLVTRRDGRVFAFTDCDTDLTVSGVTYAAATGYTASAIQSSVTSAVDNLEVQGALDSSAITETDLVAGLWDFAEIEIFQVNYLDVSMGILRLRKGNLGEVRAGLGVFVAELRGLLQRLQQSFGRTVTPTCNADLGDARCGVDLLTFPDGKVSGTLTAVDSNRQFTDSTLGQATGWFAAGVITFTAGANAGLSAEVKTFTSGGIVLTRQPFPFTVAVGDAYTMTAGCDKTLATCKAKFDKVINYRGFPDVPGISRVMSGA